MSSGKRGKESGGQTVLDDAFLFDARLVAPPEVLHRWNPQNHQILCNMKSMSGAGRIRRASTHVDLGYVNRIDVS